MPLRVGFLLLLCVLLAGCARTEVTVLFGPRRVDGDTAPGAMLQVSRLFGRHGICAYVHQSDPTSGRPFNDRYDSNSDLGACGLTWRPGE